MAGRSRYNVSDAETGFDDGVLRNKLGIRRQAELDDAETVLLSDSYSHFFDLQSQGKLTYDVALLFGIHKYFFAPLYSWAGKIRTVSISKDGVLFAPAENIPAAMKELALLVKRCVPSNSSSKRQVAEHLAVVHCEFNAIHPFREGNGRTIRLFLDLLALRAGYSPIDWSTSTQDVYISACIDGMVKEYGSMRKIVYRGLTRSAIAKSL